MLRHACGFKLFCPLAAPATGPGGLSARETAKKAGLPQTTVWNWTVGISLPDRVEDFEPLTHLLGCQLGDFRRYLEGGHGDAAITGAAGGAAENTVRA
jgi:hypothetical protein